MVTFGAVKKQTYPLIETGEYVFVLNDLGEISGDYGDRMQWDFLVALKEDPTGYVCRQDGQERVLRFFTDPEITLGSRQHQWIQALAGRSFGEGDALPDGDALLGKRMLAYLTHYTPKKGKNQGVPREDIVAGSAKPFKLPGEKTNGAAPAAPSADLGELRARAARLISRAVKLDTPNAARYGGLDLDDADAEQLQQLIVTVQADIQEALDGVPF